MWGAWPPFFFVTLEDAVNRPYRRLTGANAKTIPSHVTPIRWAYTSHRQLF